MDEVQRVPELFSAIKLPVDNNRIAGRFILTGSVDVYDKQAGGIAWKPRQETGKNTQASSHRYGCLPAP